MNTHASAASLSLYSTILLRGSVNFKEKIKNLFYLKFPKKKNNKASFENLQHVLRIEACTMMGINSKKKSKSLNSKIFSIRTIQQKYSNNFMQNQ